MLFGARSESRKERFFPFVFQSLIESRLQMPFADCRPLRTEATCFRRRCATARGLGSNHFLFLKEVHKAEKMFKDKPFPHYHELCTIFGKDRATGKNAETPIDVVEELGGDTNDDMFDGMDVSMSFGTSSTEGSSKKKRKRSSNVDHMICEAMTSSASLMSSDIKSSSEPISRAHEDSMSKNLKCMLNGQLMKLSRLSVVERHGATIQIGRDSDLTEFFFTIDDHEREEWVKVIDYGILELELELKLKYRSWKD